MDRPYLLGPARAAETVYFLGVTTARHRGMAAALAASILAATALAAEVRAKIVVCAPGAPGTTEEAQPAMDAFAAALAAKASLPAGELGATYAASEEAGIARLRAADASLAIVSLPFFLKHEKSLALRAKESSPSRRVAQGESAGVSWPAEDASRRRARSTASPSCPPPASRPGSCADRRSAAGEGCPRACGIVQSAAVLSALRRAAAGEQVAVLLDGAQEAALPTLPLASELEVVARSPVLPVGIVAAVDRRVAPARWEKVRAALRELPSDPAGSQALAGIRMSRFEPLDTKAMSAARRAYAEALR